MSRALVFGGAFNPPTAAHIDLAESAMKETGADHVIFVPTKQTYIRNTQHKEFAFSDEERLSMLETIARDSHWMIVSRYEIEAEKQPRTYETLCHYRDEGFDCSLLFGSDKLPELETVWKHVDRICQEFGIVCMKRSDDAVEELLENDAYLKTIRQYIRIIETPVQTRHVSSTAIRRSLAQMIDLYADIKQSLPPQLHGMILGYVEKGEHE